MSCRRTCYVGVSTLFRKIRPQRVARLRHSYKTWGNRLLRGAVRTMEMHSTLDQAHGAEALVMLDSLPLNDWHHEVLGVAALHFLAGTAQMDRELLDEFPE